jgi:hypothetical protein
MNGKDSTDPKTTFVFPLRMSCKLREVILTTRYSNPKFGYDVLGELTGQQCNSQNAMRPHQDQRHGSPFAPTVHATGGQEEIMAGIESSHHYGRGVVSPNTNKCLYHQRILCLQSPQHSGRGQGLDGVKRMLTEGPGEQSSLVMMEDGNLNIMKEDCTCVRYVVEHIMLSNDK